MKKTFKKMTSLYFTLNYNFTCSVSRDFKKTRFGVCKSSTETELTNLLKNHYPDINDFTVKFIDYLIPEYNLDITINDDIIDKTSFLVTNEMVSDYISSKKIISECMSSVNRQFEELERLSSEQSKMIRLINEILG